MDDLAAAFSPERGRCFRLVDVRDGQPVACDAQVLASGWLEIDGRWYQADGCNRHSAELRLRGRLGEPYRPGRRLPRRRPASG